MDLDTEDAGPAQHTLLKAVIAFGGDIRATLARDPETNWQLLDVPGADHDQQLMAPAA